MELDGPIGDPPLMQTADLQSLSNLVAVSTVVRRMHAYSEAIAVLKHSSTSLKS